MIRALPAVLVLLLAAPAAAATSTAEVTVKRSGDGFLATFTLPAKAPAWGFFRSSPERVTGTSWRLASWRVLTPGVRLVRRGNYDALVANRGFVPAHVRVAFVPFTGDLVSDYVPALRIGKGTALFDGHFALFAVDRPAVLDGLPVDPEEGQIEDFGTRVRFVAPPRRFRLAGDIAGYQRGESAGAYGLFDVPVASARNGVATIIAPQLPKWLRDDLVDYAPRVIGVLSERIGPTGLDQPTIIAAWEGARDPGASMNGGALDALILMRFSGAQVIAPNAALASMVHWFIAHEASHFWLGQTLAYDRTADSWIMEGGADLLAIRTVAALDPGYDVRSKLREELGDCAKLASQPVAAAAERNEQRAFYACGAIFALVAEKYSGGDYFAFVRRLIAAHRDPAVIAGADWLKALSAAGAPPAVVDSIVQLVEKGSAEPAAALDRLLREAGIPHQRDKSGIPRL